MTVSESLLRAAALIEQARTAIKPYSKEYCEHCGSVPISDREEYKLAERTLSLVEKCKELALSDFGQRPITRPRHVRGPRHA
jgi:hypothetical protein